MTTEQCTHEERERLEAELARLTAELRERRSNLPAHTIRPHQLIVLEELEERIAEIRGQLGREESA